MPADAPIACSLSASALSDRLAEVEQLGRDALVDALVEGGTARLRFRADAATKARVEALAAAESQCCPFLDLAVAESAGAIELSIAAPPGAELVVEELVEAFRAASYEP